MKRGEKGGRGADFFSLFFKPKKKGWSSKKNDRKWGLEITKIRREHFQEPFIIYPFNTRFTHHLLSCIITCININCFDYLHSLSFFLSSSLSFSLTMKDFPMEIIDKISSTLNGQDIVCFIQSNSALYYRAQHPLFWKHLCELNGINYCHPYVTWKGLFRSGELPNMCPHLNTSMLDSSFIQAKKQLVWSQLKNNRVVCLDSACNFFGKLHIHI